MEPEIKKGIYRHYKNKKEYKVFGVARHTETEEWLVLYEPLYENAWAKCLVRPYDMFLEKVTDPETDEQVDRFQFIKE